MLVVPSAGKDIVPRSVGEAEDDESGQDEEKTEKEGFDEGAGEDGENVGETAAEIGGAALFALQRQYKWIISR